MWDSNSQSKIKSPMPFQLSQLGNLVTISKNR